MDLLGVRELSVRFGARCAVDRLDLDIGAGDSVGLVGESGSGKSQAALAILGLSAGRVTGSVCFEGRELVGCPERMLGHVRGTGIAAVFQNPAASLNPHLRIGIQMAEVLEVHLGVARAAAFAECRRLLAQVRVADADRRLRQYPHELSGGLCQRVAIAMALAASPRLLVADEPTTALDMTVQAQLLDLLRELRAAHGLALLLISHDLAVVAEVCDRVLVMRAGQVLERGPTGRVLCQPQHDYTSGLIAAPAIRALPATGRPER